MLFMNILPMASQNSITEDITFMLNTFKTLVHIIMDILIALTERRIGQDSS